MKALFFAALISMTGFFAQADGEHTPDVCTEDSPKVCAHLGHMKGFDTASEAEFVAHAMVEGNQELSDFNVSIWFKDEGCDDWYQGSTVPTQTKMRANKYKVTGVRFEKAELTQVRISYSTDDQANTLVIPVTIEQKD